MPTLPLAELVALVMVLLISAIAIRAFSKRFHLPFTVMLVIGGVVLAELARHGPAALHHLADLRISSELILLIFLPTLIFESAFNLDSRQLRHNLLPVLVLAIPGVLLSTALIGLLLWWALPVNAPMAFLLGAILSATDPVAVIALFKQLGAPQRLSVLVEGESLLNDATAIVLARILIGVVAAGTLSGGALLAGVADFFWVFFGGLLVGWLAALLTGFLLSQVEADTFIEVPLTLVLAYVSFLLAEEVFHVSGVMAVVAAGMVMGGWGRTKISPPVAKLLGELWEYFAFTANALIFLLVGLQVDLAALGNSLDLLLWVIFAMLLSRLAVVYGLVPLVGRLPHVTPIDWRYQTVMYWGGLRGAIALALVLSLPESELKNTFIALVMGAVLFTLLVQGLSIEPLVKWLGLNQPPLGDRLAQAETALLAQRQALQQIPNLQAGGLFSARIARELSAEYSAQEQRLHADLEQLQATALDPEQERRALFSHCFATEKGCYYELFSNGHLSERGYRDLAHSLDLQGDAMRHRGELPHSTLYPRWRRWLEPRLNHWLSLHARLRQWTQYLRLQRTARSYEKTWAQFQGNRRVVHELEELHRTQAARPEVLEQVQQLYRTWKHNAQRRLDEMAEQFPEFVNLMQERLARRTLLHSQQNLIRSQAHSGFLPVGVADNMLEELQQNLRELRAYSLHALTLQADELLRKVPFFEGLSDREFEQIAHHLHAYTLPAQENIIRQGEKGRSLFLIARGVVRISQQGEDGESHDRATLFAGDFFGEHALLHDEVRGATCRTVTPCALYELRRESLDSVRAVCPGLQHALEQADRQRRKI